MPLDRSDRPVEIGDWVRILHIDPAAFEHLPPKDAADLASMLGDTLQVYRTGENTVSVEKFWCRGKGRVESHSLSILARDVERVETLLE